MQQLLEDKEKTPEQQKFNQELKSKHEQRLLTQNKKKNSTSYYFHDPSPGSVKDMSSSISFGMTFIFSFFMAGLTGYYFGVYFFSFNMAKVNNC